jgi:hypothetical protein
MNSPLQDALNSVSQKFIAYLPNLVAGIVLLAIGWIAGWIVKRVIVQLCLLLRLEKLLRRFRWGEQFSKADVRYAAYEFAGNMGFTVAVLLFLNAALEALQLTVFSDLVEQGVRFFPRAAIALVIFIAGWITANLVAASLQRNLTKEAVPRASLIALFWKFVLLLTFSAMALVEIDLAREVVLLGFSFTLVTLGVLTVVIVASRRAEIANDLLGARRTPDVPE